MSSYVPIRYNMVSQIHTTQPNPNKIIADDTAGIPTLTCNISLANVFEGEGGSHCTQLIFQEELIRWVDLLQTLDHDVI